MAKWPSRVSASRASWTRVGPRFTRFSTSLRASHLSLLILPPDSVDACDIEIGGDSENRRLQRYLRTSFCDNLASKLHDSSENIFHFILLLKRSMILIELLPLGIRVDRGNGIEIEDSMKEGMKVSRAGNAVEKILDR